MNAQPVCQPHWGRDSLSFELAATPFVFSDTNPFGENGYTADSGDLGVLNNAWLAASHASFVDCMNGLDTLPTPAPPTTADNCLRAFDNDGDDDVDLSDFDAFSVLIGG